MADDVFSAELAMAATEASVQESYIDMLFSASQV